MIQLSSPFQKLQTNIQFAYTVTQDHPVFASLRFWETAFYADVEKNIQSLYVPPESPNSTEKRDVSGG